ncbi:hypothetical protein COCMIDRAFT_90881 [Bipolaris oryzae ATCC 44560]|uniref:Uncharacterized protein n=1 Tax=Bipolaris oryzae ATCC 44560 TaxID=930090 RepID=W6Z5U1_COCMI|nr:uncharacterized protein COCMIDRAFT_90881 [Bipolaris oryzae ATCC 44560]EUC47122.1 hypothetical protein COCMIDRAFT_90881 [Bipolaris oryzae ATCC 44560]
MRRPPYLLFLLLTFLSSLSVSLAASPTSFCKCTCFGNSTIVALDAPSAAKKPTRHVEPRASKKTCNDCNRQFCLGYSFCTGEKEENVLTTCFQRDSAKDQAVVFIFIGATLGLLGWAGLRPWIEGWREACIQRRSYMPMAGQGNQ